MKHKFKLALIASCMLGLCGNLYANKNEQALDQIVAVVNNSVITQTELNKATVKIKTQLLATHTPIPDNNSLHKQVLDQLINRKLQLDLAEQSNIKITDTDIDHAVERIATANKITSTQLYAAIAKQGISKTDYRNELKDEMSMQRVQQQAIGSKVNITPQEVDDFMRSAAWAAHNAKEYHLEDILIELPDSPTSQVIADARKRANALVAKLKTPGTLFREAALTESGGEKALQGGDLGWRKLPEIPSAFSVPILEAHENDIIGPIQTPNGFHIVHVAGIRNVNMQGDTNSQHAQVQQLLFERKYEESVQNWLAKVRSEAFINTPQEA